MAKVITQETFDEVVKENIVEFSMTVDEAKIETIEQFEAQVFFVLIFIFFSVQFLIVFYRELILET